MNSQRKIFQKELLQNWGGDYHDFHGFASGHGKWSYSDHRVNALWIIWQAATEQGVVPVSNPDLCPIFKDRQVIPDEDWCGPCREEFYDTVMESGDTDSPAEQGVGEAVGEIQTYQSTGNHASVTGVLWYDGEPESGSKLYTHPPKPTGGGVPDDVIRQCEKAIDDAAIARGGCSSGVSEAQKRVRSILLATQQLPEQE